MTGARAVWLVIALALAALGGIVGMLLTEGTWNAAFFVLAALPLLAGAWSLHRQRRRVGRAKVTATSSR